MTESAAYSSGLPRPQSMGEELVNAVTHGVGALLGAAGLVLLLSRTIHHGGGGRSIAGDIVFGVSMILLYLISCMYHALPRSKAKNVFQVLDHCTIFILISGTYAPICLVKVPGKLGIAVFSVNLACAVLGIILNAIDLKRWKKLSLALYIIMGWMAVIVLPVILHTLSLLGFILLLAGGVAYTVGVIFYRKKEKRYWHGIWHCFVLAGTILQFFAVYTNCCY